MRLLLVIPLLVVSCSLIFHPDKECDIEPRTSSQHETVISVPSDITPLLLTDQYSTETFTASVSHNGSDNYSGTVRLRGQTTLDEYPRSFAVELHYDSTLTLDSTELSRFSVIPFRSDTNFVYSLMGYYFFGKNDLFAPKISVTKLSINDTYQGVYLGIEHSVDALMREDSRTEFVLRRRYGGFYDIKEYEPKDSLHQLTQGDYAKAYETVHTLPLLYSDTHLLTALQERMDLKQYFQMLALNLLFANGDFHDELFYAGRAVRDSNGVITPYFTFSTWDLNELFSEPYDNKFTEGSLLFCNDNRFDRIVEENEILYNSYTQEVQFCIDSVITDEAIDNCQTFIQNCLNIETEKDTMQLGEHHYSKEHLLTLLNESVALLTNRREEIRLRIE